MATSLPSPPVDFSRPTHHLGSMGLSHTAAKPKGLAKNPAASKSKAQMHRRSRTGCYTCRLRRKKCDEGNPLCTACRHLGLVCEYKRPIWWSNSEARKKHKDDIKMIIKRKKLSEKTTHCMSNSSHSPPGLSHSIPTSATFSEPLDRTRSGSTESQFSGRFHFENQVDGVPTDFAAMGAQMHPDFLYAGFSPYEIDVKTERQLFVNDVPTIHESTVSTFSTFTTPPPPGTILHQMPAESAEWVQVLQDRGESLTEEALNLNFFDFSNGPAVEARQVSLELEEADQDLLNHFIQFVMPAIFPVLEANQHGSVASDLILPALQSNKGFLHCCLSVAAQHIKSTAGMAADEIDQAIMRHRYETVSTLCEALNRDENHQEILEAALAQILYQTVVGRFDDSLPDISWHKHFEAAISLVQRLDLPRLVADPAHPPAHPPFNMTLTSWIDILGATLLGRAPTFAHTYREKLVHPEIVSLGLRELMGCDDRIMYLISEIACLEALKTAGMDDITLCHHVHTLGEHIGLTEVQDSAIAPRMPYNANGSLSPRQLSRNITTAFRLAARIYLCSLVPGFSPSQESCMGLVERLAQVAHYIPPGSCGFDRSMAWVYLTAGSVSMPGSGFRAFFLDRASQLADLAHQGVFGRVAAVLREVWAQTDCVVAAALNMSHPNSAPDSLPYVHWRDVMQMKGWDFLIL